MVMGMANLAMVTGNIGREGVGVNPLRGQNNVQGSCDMGSFPHEFPGYRHVSRDEVRSIYESLWGLDADRSPACGSPTCSTRRSAGRSAGSSSRARTSRSPTPTPSTSRRRCRRWTWSSSRTCSSTRPRGSPTSSCPALSFLEKDGTFTNAERRINRVRPVFPSRVGKDEWRVVCEIAQAMGYDMHYDSAAEIMDEIAATTPTFAGVSFAALDAEGSMQWPVNDAAPHGTPTMHVGEFVRGKGHLVETVYVPTTERTTRRYPLVLTTGRILSQYNVGAQTRRTPNQTWHPEDVLEIHPADADLRGISTGDQVELSSRVGHDLALRRGVRADARRRRLHDLPPPVTGANVVTTENSDWATNCPEYKVTAVQVGVANAGERAEGAAAQRDLAARQ